MCIYIYIYIYTYMCIYIYIYIYNVYTYGESPRHLDSEILSYQTPPS